MEATTTSRSWSDSWAPLGRVRSAARMVAPMSRPVRSTVSSSGIESAGTISSTSWMAMFSVPPRFRPGESSWLKKWTGTEMRINWCSLTR